jgi:hypothetical protein
MKGVQGGFFLRKKPLGLVLSVYSNSENAIAAALLRNGLLGRFLFKISFPLGPLLLVLILLIMDALDKRMHHVIECAAWRQGAAVEYIGIGVGLDLRRNTSQ